MGEKEQQRISVLKSAVIIFMLSRPLKIHKTPEYYSSSCIASWIKWKLENSESKKSMSIYFPIQ